MSFNKAGTPQPLSVINTCSCGKEATKMINGKMYCDDCLPKIITEESVEEDKNSSGEENDK